MMTKVNKQIITSIKTFIRQSEMGSPPLQNWLVFTPPDVHVTLEDVCWQIPPVHEIVLPPPQSTIIVQSASSACTFAEKSVKKTRITERIPSIESLRVRLYSFFLLFGFYPIKRNVIGSLAGCKTYRVAYYS